MRTEPTEALSKQLARVQLATPSDVRRVARRVRRLAGELPHFDSIWIDALAQARCLTAFQADELRTGRGDRLAIGPFVLSKRLTSCEFAEQFLAKRIRSTGEDATQRPRKAATMRLLVAEMDPSRREDVHSQLTALIEHSQAIASPHVQPVLEFGVDGNRIWMAAEHRPGVTAHDWTVENGRFPPLVALQLARQLAHAMQSLEDRGLLHGDLHVRNITLSRKGLAQLSHPGVQPIFRPIESADASAMSLECYEGLSPERMIHGSRHDLASEMFAFGCLLWQLLTARPAVFGGNRALKLQTLARWRPIDVRQIAPDAPPILAEIIAACLSSDPNARPKSFVELISLLGPLQPQGARVVQQCLRSPTRWLLPTTHEFRRRSGGRQLLVETLATSAVIATVVGSWWLTYRSAADNPKPLIAVDTAIATPMDWQAKQHPLAEQQSAASEVTLASHQSPDASPIEEGPPPLALPTDRPLRLNRLAPRESQTVCGREGQPATIIVPQNGLVITSDNVTFRDVHFVAESGASDRPMLRLQAASLTLERCIFQSQSAGQPRTAIVWEERMTADDDWSPAGDGIHLVDVVFQRIHCAIKRSRPGDAEIHGQNVLMIGGGEFVELCDWPATGETVAVILKRCTFRESGSVVSIAGNPSKAPGRIAVHAKECVFAPQAGTALVNLQADVLSSAADAVRWAGRNSLCDERTPLVAIMNEPIADESAFKVFGLSRGRLAFAGSDLNEPTDSTLHRWVGPRRSAEVPGIDATRLPSLPLDANSQSKEFDKAGE